MLVRIQTRRPHESFSQADVAVDEGEVTVTLNCFSSLRSECRRDEPSVLFIVVIFFSRMDVSNLFHKTPLAQAENFKYNVLFKTRFHAK